jgi:hypothetical protein
MKKLRVIVGGFLGLLPAGGVTWDYVQYPLGLMNMGHDVYYIEDTRLYPLFQKPGSNWGDCSTTVTHLRTVMTYFDMSDRWAYRDEASGKTYGLSDRQIQEVCQTADVFINISCSTVMREEYARIPIRILIDSDPMFTQIQYMTDQTFTEGASKIRSLIHQHNYHFTFGENIGAANCHVPTGDIRWRPTRQPIALEHWPVNVLPPLKSASLTTVMNWAAGKNLQYENEEWGQKDMEFHNIMSIPALFPDIRFSLVVGQTERQNHIFPQKEIELNRWQIQRPEKVAGNWVHYQHFIADSLGEISVAKHTYVKAQTGWFSCRSACYLATGRPVVTQETGWSAYIPSGQGVFAFCNREEATEAIRRIANEPGVQAKAARRVAEDYFDSRKVLLSMLDQLN